MFFDIFIFYSFLSYHLKNIRDRNDYEKLTSYLFSDYDFKFISMSSTKSFYKTENDKLIFVIVIISRILVNVNVFFKSVEKAKKSKFYIYISYNN